MAMTWSCPLLVAPLLSGGDLPSFDRVHLVFAEEHRQSLISGFGHLFVVLVEGEVGGIDDLLTGWTLNFGADTGPLGDGLWTGEYHLDLAHALTRQYTRLEMRSLTAFELDLDEHRLKLLREDLRDRLDRKYPYDFIRHNCGHYLLDWLNGPELDSPPVLYQTPRESLGLILESCPARAVRYRASALEVLEVALNSVGESGREATKDVIRGRSRLRDLEDTRLGLLAVPVVEAFADAKGVQAARSDIRELLARPDGRVASIQVQKHIERVNKVPPVERLEEHEGPSVSGISVFDSERSEVSHRLVWQAGLRDLHTKPWSADAARDVALLRAEVGRWKGRERVSVDWLEVNSLRSSSSLVSRPSNGFSVASKALEDPLGRRGLSLSSWTGLGLADGLTWYGVRLNLVLDDLLDDPGAFVAPGVYLARTASTGSLQCRVDCAIDRGLGGELKGLFAIAPNSHFMLRATLDPEDGLHLGTGISFGF
jgi:hypothetical protein